jgi:phosphatidylserine/phosphatidylglycerophosphate/cardiolipin synthase-like enzyme
MVDDVVAKLGSSNLNRRSYSNDTELDAVLCDEAVDNGGRRFIKQFRKELWGEHLGLSGAQRELLDDVDYAMTFFSNPPKGARIRAYDHNAEIEADHNQAWWDDAVDPDGRLTD